MSIAFRPDLSGDCTDLQIRNPLGAFRSAMGMLTSGTQSETTTMKVRDTYSYIIAVMPEAHAEGYEDFPQKLLGHYHQDTMMRCLDIAIFFASNNLSFPTKDAAYAITSWLFLRENLSVLRHLLSFQGPTTEALAEYLFGFAVEAENMMVIKTMLRMGLSSNSSRTTQILTPLQHASKTGNIELTRLLVDNGAELDTAPSTYLLNSFTPLMLAVKAQNPDLVNLLTAAGASLNMKARSGDSALSIATRLGNLTLVRILISKGADVNWLIFNDEETESLLSLAAGTGSIKLTECILDAGSEEMGPAVFSATVRGEMEIIQILLDAGADINYPSHKGLTALTGAIIRKNAKLADFLLGEGANVNGLASHLRTDRCHNDDCLCGTEVWDFPPITPLQAASLRDMTEFAKILLEAGADVNTPFCQHRGLSWRSDYLSNLDGGDDEDNDCHGDREYNGTALQLAVYRLNWKLVEILLESGANVNAAASGFCGRTALQAAVEKGDNYLVNFLLDAGANVNAAASSFNGRTALQAAVEKGDNYLVKFLLDAGADVNAAASVKYGRTALQAAVGKDDTYLVQFLLKAGANVNEAASGIDGRTALQAAIEKGNKILIKCLLDAGANINAPASEVFGRTALQFAVEKGDKNLVQCLIDAGADVNGLPGEFGGLTALTAAVERGDSDLISLLLNAGANVNHLSTGSTALKAAMMNNDIDLVHYLLDNGADVDDPGALLSALTSENIELIQILLAAREKIDGLGGKSFVFNALLAAIKKQEVQIIQSLLAGGIMMHHHLCDQMNCRYISAGSSKTALSTAVYTHNILLVRTLLEAGADPNVIEWDDFTPLSCAIMAGNTPLVRLLVEAGANVNLLDQYRSCFYNSTCRNSCSIYKISPLELAARGGHSDMVDVLLEAGANVNSLPCRSHGLTALQSAAIGGFFDIARMLINKNADVNAEASTKGRTALEGAAGYGRIDLVQLLLNAGAEIKGAGGVQYHRALEFAAKKGHYAVCRLLRSFHDSRYGTSDLTSF